MSNQQAIASLRTLCHNCKLFPKCAYEKSECFKAIELAISALQAQDSPKPTAESVQNVQNEDLISRKAAIEAMSESLKRVFPEHRQIAEKCLKALPSAQPEPCDDAVSREAAIDAALSAFSRGLLASPDIRKLPSVQPEPHWIPVSERLPKLDEAVFVTTEWDDLSIAWRIGIDKWFIHEGNTNATTDDLTAWMPLPEPYRAERRADGV